MRRKPLYNRDSGFDSAMTPMIDVVFLLLIFFVWTASFQVVEYLLPSQLSAVAGSQPADPQEPPPPEEDFEDVVIRIVWDGQQPAWKMNGATMSGLVEVRASLAAIAALKKDAPLIVHPDRETPLEYVIEAYDAARLEGFEKVQFAASEE